MDPIELDLLSGHLGTETFASEHHYPFISVRDDFERFEHLKILYLFFAVIAPRPGHHVPVAGCDPFDIRWHEPWAQLPLQ